ncbi:MAG: DUF445 domain-containing protein [Nocardioidaceae bacterium]
MRWLALGLLLVAAAVYAATLSRDGGWRFVYATAEGAMVGAIADWFAVTALFRHPLGLPIPHTAIIPTRKNALALSLEEFVTENFLAEDTVRARVAGAQVSSRVGAWLAEPGHSVRVVDEAASLLTTALRRIDDEDVATLVETELLPRLVDEPLSKVAGRLLEDVVAEKAHHGLVDLAINEAHEWLGANEAAVSRALGERAPWWTPQWLDEQVTRRLHIEAVAWVADIRNDNDHPARRALDDFLSQLAHDLQHDPGTIESAERLKQRVLTQPQVLETAMSLWGALKRVLLEMLADTDSTLKSRAVTAFREFGDRLGTDAALRNRLDLRAADLAAFLVERYGAEFTQVITDTIERWDGDEAARRIELHVGRDLQFIRINGTLVGGLAGLVIYRVGLLLSR